MLVRGVEVTPSTQGSVMGAHNAGHGAAKSARTCGSCGSALARDNTGTSCSRCLREQRDQLRTPPAHLPDEFWETDDFLAAFENQHIGKVFKVYRNHPRHRQIYGKALNQETLGRWLGLKQSALSKIETGPPETNTEVVRVYADKLHIPKHLMWFKYPGEKYLTLRERTAVEDNVSLVRVATPAIAPQLVHSYTADVLNGSVDTDPEERLRKLVVARSHFEQMYRNSGGLVTAGRIELYLARQTLPIAAMMTTDVRNTARIENRTKRAIGGLVAFAGVCAYDSEDWTTANVHFQQAFAIAEQTRDRGFQAYVIALMANQALALEDFKVADALTDLGLRSSISAGDIALTIDLQAMKAKALASMGNNPAAMSVIGELEDAIEGIATHKSIAEASYIQEVQLRSKLAEALISLGDFTAAQRYAEQLFVKDDHPRGKVNRLASKATLEVAQGEIERASLVVCEMVDNARGMESRRLRSRFAELRTALARRPATVSRDAIDRLDMALMLMS